MSMTLLRVTSVVQSVSRPVRLQFDCPTRGVVILEIALEPSLSPAPLHWRAGDWSKPPLDIRLSNEGVVEAIEVVFQDERVDTDDVVVPRTVETGLPVFDVAEWPSDRYADIHVPVNTFRLASGALYIRVADDEAVRACAVSRLRFDLGAADQLVGIECGPLSAEDWYFLDASAP